MSFVDLHNHVRELVEEAYEVKCIGIYSSVQKAQAASARLMMQPGFKDHPEGFEIGEYELGENHWEEDFVTGAIG